MLETIRRRGRGLLAWILVIGITIPFAFWGISNYFQVGKERPLVVVGDVEIYEQDVQRYYEETLARFLPFSDEKRLKRLALEQLIQNTLLVQEARRQGIEVSDEEVALFLKQLPEFQTSGRFDPKKFEAFLAARGITSDYLLRRLKQAILIEKLQAGIRESVPVTDAEAARFYALQNEVRQVAYLILPEALAGEVQVTEEELLAYYQNHLDRFTEPEKVQVLYIELSPELLASRIELSEEKLKERYNADPKRWIEPERRRARHILIAFKKGLSKEEARKRAEALLERLKKGEDFARLAREFSDDPLSREKGGDLGWIEEGSVTEPLYEAISKLKPGEIQLVESPFGFHLVQVTEVRPARKRSFEEVKEQLAEELRREEAERRFSEVVEEIANLAYENAGTLEPIARAFGLEIKTSPFFSREEGEGIAADPKVREAAFSENVLAGENSEPIELPDGRVVVLRLKERRPPRQKPFEEVREEIRAELLRQKRREALLDKARALLEEGKPLQELASELGLELKRAELRRNLPFEGDPSATARLFSASRGSPFLLDLADGRLLLVEVVARHRPDFKALQEGEKAQWREELRRLYGQVELRQYVKQLREEAEIEFLKEPEE